VRDTLCAFALWLATLDKTECDNIPL
jgi:hypothetical protein